MRIFGVVLFFIVCSLSTLLAQTDSSDTKSTHIRANFLNPYVSESSLYWLRSKEIDLFEIAIADEEFKKNARNTILYRNEYRREKFGFAAFMSIGVFGLVAGAGSQFIGNETSNVQGQAVMFTAIGIGSLVKAFIVKEERKVKKRQFEHQLELTRNQYNLLIRN